MPVHNPYETTILGFATTLTIYEDLQLKTGITHVQFSNILPKPFVNLIKDNPGKVFVIKMTENGTGKELRTYLKSDYAFSETAQINKITGLHLGTKEDFEGLGLLGMAENADREYDLQKVIQKMFNSGSRR